MPRRPQQPAASVAEQAPARSDVQEEDDALVGLRQAYEQHLP
ncbi:hypothetical protein SNL152K_10596 [Streptomyces sp. NL15-2K]|nr:hypothetical protein SNL152K_10596 [Streptomyces sp. NL15-2K]